MDLQKENKWNLKLNRGKDNSGDTSQTHDFTASKSNIFLTLNPI